MMAIYPVWFSVLTTGIGQSMTFALLAPLGREVGLGEVQVGMIITCSALMFTLTSPVWGRLSDRIGRKPVLLIGQLGYSLGALLFATVFLYGLNGTLSGNRLFFLAIVSRVLMAALTSAAPSAATGYVADTSETQLRLKSLGRLGAARTLGAILGPAMSGLLVVMGLLTPLYVAACMTLISSLWLVQALKEPLRRPPETMPPVRSGLFDPRYFSFLLIGFLTFFAFSMMSQTIGFYFQDRFALDATGTAQALGMGMMVSAGMSFFAQGILVQRMALTPRQLLRCGLPVLAVGYGALLWADSIFMLVLFLGLLGLGLGLVAPGFTAAASLAVGPDEQGAVGGLVAACPAAGFVLGPLVGTQLYQWNGGFPYLVASLLMLPLIIYTRSRSFHN